jgi:hypothetical protein
VGHERFEDGGFVDVYDWQVRIFAAGAYLPIDEIQEHNILGADEIGTRLF